MSGPLSIDPASYRNRGGLITQMRTAWRLRRHFNRWGTGNVISPRADFRITDGGMLEIGNDCSILDYAFFQLTKPQPKVVIGDRTVIGRHTMITAKNSIRIGNDVLIGAYVQIIDHSHGFDLGTPIRQQPARIGTVEIGNDVWIGAGAKILYNVKISDGAVIGSNAVVTKDVDSNSIVGGVPARFIRTR